MRQATDLDSWTSGPIPGTFSVHSQSKQGTISGHGSPGAISSRDLVHVQQIRLHHGSQGSHDLRPLVRIGIRGPTHPDHQSKVQKPEIIPETDIEIFRFLDGQEIHGICPAQGHIHRHLPLKARLFSIGQYIPQGLLIHAMIRMR